MSWSSRPLPRVDPNRPLSILDALGGRRGAIDSAVPGVLFAVVYGVAGLRPALWAAVGAGGVLLALRLARRETLQYAVGGFLGIAIAAFIASRTGRGQDFYVLSLWRAGGFAVLYAGSVLVRWPLLGVILGPLLGEGTAWRRHPARYRAYALATWIWVGLFLVRLAVLTPLYLAGATVALGFAVVALGWPLFAVCCWLSWLVLRRVPVVHAHPGPEDPARS